jgi:hypothetical protein
MNAPAYPNSEASCAMTWDVVTSAGKGIRLDRLSAAGSSITKESRPTTERFHITLPSITSALGVFCRADRRTRMGASSGF